MRVASSMVHAHVRVQRLTNCMALWQSRGEEGPSSQQSPGQYPVDKVEERQALAAGEDGCDDRVR